MNETGTAPMGGIYAAFDLGGAPLDPKDLVTLGLDASVGGSASAQVVDGITPGDGHVLKERDRTTAFLGRLDEPGPMADLLGMPRGTPESVLARAAYDRFGASTPSEMLGDWIMLDHTPRGGVAALVSIGGRTPMLYARRGDHVAFAPSIHVLSRLDWVGRALDDDAFLLSLTICAPDDEQGQKTILRAARRVPRGARALITREGEAFVEITEPFTPSPRWAGSRRDAMDEAEALFRRIVRQRLARSPAPGLLLSGGLDSSLIAWALVAEGAINLPALSSAVTPGRGVADETPFAAIVADALGLALHRVVPSADVNIYRPTMGTLEASNSPPLSPRDYLYAALADAAGSLGVTELFDGAHGELTFTALMPVQFWHDRPRELARGIRDSLRSRSRANPDPIDAVSSVALARHRLEDRGLAVTKAVAAKSEERWSRRSGEQWGYSAGARPPLRRDPTELRAGRLRLARPFHDIRLLRLFAGFPSSFMVGEGMSRWPARAVLAKHLPDSISRRQKGMPFSPDYEMRLVEQAPVALSRIATFRANGCDEWFDLDWLQDGIRRVAARRSPDLHDTFRVQLTAHACEFLAWWRSV